VSHKAGTAGEGETLSHARKKKPGLKNLGDDICGGNHSHATTSDSSAPGVMSGGDRDGCLRKVEAVVGGGRSEDQKSKKTEDLDKTSEKNAFSNVARRTRGVDSSDGKRGDLGEGPSLRKTRTDGGKVLSGGRKNVSRLRNMGHPNSSIVAQMLMGP